MLNSCTTGQHEATHYIKGTVNLKMKMLSLFTHSHVVPNLEQYWTPLTFTIHSGQKKPKTFQVT